MKLIINCSEKPRDNALFYAFQVFKLFTHKVQLLLPIPPSPFPKGRGRLQGTAAGGGLPPPAAYLNGFRQKLIAERKFLNQRNEAAHAHTKPADATKVSEHAAGSAAHRASAVSEHAHRRRCAAQRGGVRLRREDFKRGEP